MKDINIAIGVVVAIIVLGFIVGMVRENNLKPFFADHTQTAMLLKRQQELRDEALAADRVVGTVSRMVVQNPFDTIDSKNKILMDEINNFLVMDQKSKAGSDLYEKLAASNIVVSADLYYRLVLMADIALFANSRYPNVVHEYSAVGHGGRIRNNLNA